MVKEIYLFPFHNHGFSDWLHSSSPVHRVRSNFLGDVNSPFQFLKCVFLGTRKRYKFVHVTLKASFTSDNPLVLNRH